MELPKGAPKEANYDWPELRSYIGIPKEGPLSAKNRSHRLTYWPRTSAAMLYDHIDDPGETVNQADDPQHAEAYDLLKQHLSEFQ